MTAPEIPYVPVSWGELLDKITILEIKRARIADAHARANIARELELLAEAAETVIDRDDMAALIGRLRDVNAALWNIEDSIREQERVGAFGANFVALARAVYTRNDERAAIKRAINLALGSALVEEKSYTGLPALDVAAQSVMAE